MVSGFAFGQVKKDTLEKEYKLEATPYKVEKKEKPLPGSYNKTGSGKVAWCCSPSLPSQEKKWNWWASIT